jgi:glycosyltransferase involved in cell wall biosynthesis
MHFTFSIVIIAQNEASNLARTLLAINGLSDDVLILENGSIDDTVEVATNAGCRVISSEWLGYGDTKNYGNSLAKYNWILSLDADEVVDQTLFKSLQLLSKPDANTIFILQRLMVWDGKILKFGGSVEKKIRLFNRNTAKWNSSQVHEQLEFAKETPEKIILNGNLLHYSYTNWQDAIARNEKYAKADALKKFSNGKKYIFWMPIVRGCLEFITVYFIKGGFLDGNAGKQFAKIRQFYKVRKYQLLQAMYQ